MLALTTSKKISLTVCIPRPTASTTGAHSFRQVGCADTRVATPRAGREAGREDAAGGWVVLASPEVVGKETGESLPWRKLAI